MRVNASGCLLYNGSMQVNKPSPTVALGWAFDDIVPKPPLPQSAIGNGGFCKGMSLFAERSNCLSCLVLFGDLTFYGP